MNRNLLLMRISRYSAYVLTFLMVLFFISGYAMTGLYGMNGVIDKISATFIHLTFDGILLIFLVLHAGIEIYFELKKRKIIR